MMPRNLDDLKPAPYNPREIEEAASAGLKASLETFGDLSGVVFNLKTGHLVAGHQRVDQLRKAGARFDETAGEIVLGAYRFPVRLVEWDEATEKAANLTANNPHIAGRFTDDAAELIRELEDTLPSLDSELLGLTKLLDDIDSGDVELKELKIQPPPTMTWVLIGIPTTRYGLIAEQVEKIGACEEVVCETTANHG